MIFLAGVTKEEIANRNLFIFIEKTNRKKNF
jgi:hypothetical protein